MSLDTQHSWSNTAHLWKLPIWPAGLMGWAAGHKPSSDEMPGWVCCSPEVAPTLLGHAAEAVPRAVLQPAPQPSHAPKLDWDQPHTHTDGKTLLCMDSIPADSSQAWHSLVWSKSSLLTEAHPPWHRGHFPSHQPAPTPQMRITKVPDLSHTSFYTVTLLTSSVGLNPDLNPLHVTKCCNNWSFCWRIVLQRETDVGGMCQSAQCQCTGIFQISPLFFHHWGSTWGKTGRY